MSPRPLRGMKSRRGESGAGSSQTQLPDAERPPACSHPRAAASRTPLLVPGARLRRRPLPFAPGSGRSQPHLEAPRFTPTLLPLKERGMEDCAKSKAQGLLRIKKCTSVFLSCYLAKKYAWGTEASPNLPIVWGTPKVEWMNEWLSRIIVDVNKETTHLKKQRIILRGFNFF